MSTMCRGPKEFGQLVLLLTANCPKGSYWQTEKSEMRTEYLVALHLILGLASAALSLQFYFLFICFPSSSFVLG